MTPICVKTFKIQVSELGLSPFSNPPETLSTSSPNITESYPRARERP